MEMINYPWIVNKDIVIVDLVATEEDTFMLICTGAPVPQKIMRIFFFDFWCPTWDTRGVIRSRLMASRHLSRCTTSAWFHALSKELGSKYSVTSVFRVQ